MTAFSDDFTTSFRESLHYGEIVRLKYYNQTLVGSYYDDDATYTQSGTDIYVSGVVQPISNKQFNSDAVLLQQGKILLDDQHLYVDGTVQTSGLGPIKVGLGSPSFQEYQIINQGGNTAWTVNGAPIYKKVLLRFLTNGSFVGE